MLKKIFSKDWDKWSLVILVLLSHFAGFFIVKAVVECNLWYGVLFVIFLLAIMMFHGLPSGVRIGFAIVGLMLGSILALPI